VLHGKRAGRVSPRARGSALLLMAALLAACGGSGSPKRAQTHTVTVASAKPVRPAPPTRPVRPKPEPDQALVTAETENRLLVLDLPSGRVVRRIGVAADPEDIATRSDAHGTTAVVTSATAGEVTLLEGPPLHVVKVFGGFVAPHIVELTPVPYGYDAYVTDDARGTLSVINLPRRRVMSTTRVGAGAHHLCFDVEHQMAWVALGESARTIAVLTTVDRDHPRVIGRVRPAFAVHDLACSLSSARVWLTSATGPTVTRVGGVDQRAVFRVPVGRAPQHVALTQRYAYLTSGYGGGIEQVDARTGRILHRATTPYGSFELAADGRYVVTSSLLRGTLAIFTPQLKLLRVVHLAPATREVALSSRGGSPP
jgi:hypothetical protein